MRRLDLTFTALLIPLDFLALLGAAITAYALRYSKAFIELRPVLQEIPLASYLATASGFILIWMVLFAMAGLYALHARRAWNELGRIILGCSAGIMVVIGTVFFRREVTASRFLVLAVWALAIVYVWIGRMFLRLLRRQLLGAHIGHQRIVVIGNGKIAKDLLHVYTNTPVLGYTVVKHFRGWNKDTPTQLATLADQHAIDGILVADPDLSKEEARTLIAFAAQRHLTFRYLADLFAANFARIEVSTAEGIPILEAKRTPLDGWGRIAKRAFDIVFALVILMVTSPLLMIMALGRVLEDGLPIIFDQPRVGERERVFHLHKIRSMWRKYCVGPQFKEHERENRQLLERITREYGITDGPVKRISDGDPRITPLGRMIRRWSIDELPQMWNVLKGEMSIVGPRPHEPEEVAHYAAEHLRVLAVKPGITGMGQISGRRDLSFADEAQLDIWYIEHWSPALDLYILFKTPGVVLSKRGVY